MKRGLLLVPALLATFATTPVLAFEMDLGAPEVLGQLYKATNLNALADLQPGGRGGASALQRDDFCNEDGVLKLRASLLVHTPPASDDWIATVTDDGMLELSYDGIIDLANLATWADEWGLPLIADPCSRSTFGPDAWIAVSGIKGWEADTPFHSTSEMLGIGGDASETGAFALDVKQLEVRQKLHLPYVAQLMVDQPGKWVSLPLGLPELCVDTTGTMRVFVGNIYRPTNDAPDPGDLQISFAPDKIVSLKLDNGDWQEHRFLRTLFGAIDVPCERSPRDANYWWPLGSVNGKTRLSELLD